MSETSGSEPELEGQLIVDRRPTRPAIRPRVLVTNDDGVDAPGIAHLARSLSAAFDVTVAAPDRDWSGAGTGIGRIDPVNGVSMRRVDIGTGPAFALDGPPGLAVLAAALGAFGDPFTLVVSGINAGINTGHSVIHSGTVGAALTARTFGWSGLAVSILPSDPWHWATAAHIAAAAARWISNSVTEPTAFNLNVPGIELEAVRGLRNAELDRFGYFRVAIADETTEKLQFEVTGERDEPPPDGSDTALLGERFATITVLGSIAGSPDVLPSSTDQIWAPESSIGH